MQLTQTNLTDALHLEHHQPLHRLQMVARPRAPQSPPLPARRSPHHRLLRSPALPIPPLRILRREENGRDTQ